MKIGMSRIVARALMADKPGLVTKCEDGQVAMSRRARVPGCRASSSGRIIIFRNECQLISDQGISSLSQVDLALYECLFTYLSYVFPGQKWPGFFSPVVWIKGEGGCLNRLVSTGSYAVVVGNRRTGRLGDLRTAIL